MYENMFSTNRAEVIRWARQNAESGLRHLERAIAEAELTLSALKLKQTQDKAVLAKLEAEYFSVPGLE
jgi:hypothetical protein